MPEEKKQWVRWPEIAYAASLLLLLGMVGFLMRMPRVGVLDVAEVAKAVGEQSRLTEDAKVWRAEAKVKVTQLKNSFREQTETLLAQAEKASDPAEKEKIRARLTDLQKTTQEAVERIGRELVMRNETQMEEFRARLKPAIDEVARRHRFDVLLDANGIAGVMYINARVDVTDEVIEKARSVFKAAPAQPTLSKPELPTGADAEAEAVLPAETPAAPAPGLPKGEAE